MTSRFATVKLNSRLVDEARREAALLHRSLSGQIEHWAQLGRALENAQGFSIDRVRSVLNGDLNIEELDEGEQEALFRQLHAHFQAPSADLRAAYAELGEQRRKAGAARRRSGGRASKPAA